MGCALLLFGLSVVSLSLRRRRRRGNVMEIESAFTINNKSIYIVTLQRIYVPEGGNFKL